MISVSATYSVKINILIQVNYFMVECALSAALCFNVTSVHKNHESKVFQAGSAPSGTSTERDVTGLVGWLLLIDLH